MQSESIGKRPVKNDSEISIDLNNSLVVCCVREKLALLI